MFTQGDCYAKDGVWCIICISDETTTIWRTRDDRTCYPTPTMALKFYLELHGWVEQPFKVSPLFRDTGMLRASI